MFMNLTGKYMGVQYIIHSTYILKIFTFCINWAGGKYIFVSLSFNFSPFPQR